MLDELRETAIPVFWLIVGLLASAFYLYGASLVRVEGHYTPPVPLFPPQAVILAVLLRTRPRTWWLLLSVFYGMRILTGVLGGISTWFTLISNIPNVIEPLTGALLVRHFLPLPPTFARLRDVSLYAASVVGAATLGATLGATVRVFAGSEFWASWQAWFLGDALASLLLAPAILLWTGVNPGRLLRTSRWQVVEIGVLVAALLVVGYLVFGVRVNPPEAAPALLYVPVPLLLWAAVRFGPFGLASALGLVTVFAIGSVANGLGPFAGQSRQADLLELQLFLLGIGVPLFFLAALVLERQQARTELEQSERRYRAVVSNFPHGGVLLFASDLRHLLADGQGLAAAGLRKEAIQGKTLHEAFPPEMASLLAPHYRSALAGRSASFDLPHAGRTYQMQVLPIPGQSSTTGMLVMQDVTEQRRVEVLSELDRAKTAFFDNVSHEFRTPLALLLGPLEDLLDAPPERLLPEIRHQLQSAYRNGQRLLKLVNTLLDLSRLEAGRLSPRYMPTDLSAYTAELAGVFRSAIEHAGLQLVVDCPALPEPVYVDRDQWEHIVFNLLSNALKFTFSGEIRVTLRARGPHAVLVVQDTGTGIPPEELSHLFERFHRVPGRRGRTEEGTGIGLAFVQELVRLHGGSVSARSVVEVGSAFTVAIPFGTAHLPCERISSSPPTARASRAASYVDEAQRWLEESADGSAADEQSAGVLAPHGSTADRGERAVRLLVVDDNADMRAYLASLLRDRGMVQAVGDAATALDIAHKRPPDLLIADVMLPGLDGLALLHAVRADPDLRLTPVILLSARAGEQARLDGLRAGADDYLVKPFGAAELLARVDGQLELVRERGEARAVAERRRLARDLHDSVSQTLYAANVTAEALPELWDIDPSEGRRALADLRRLTGSAQAEMRSLLVELRPEALAHTPLEELLRTLVTTAASKTPAAITAELDPAPALPPEVQEALYRIAQEALHNAVKHARAAHVTLRLESHEAGSLRLRIVDDGRGFDPNQARNGRLGLRSMRERAASIGATIEVDSAEYQGTTVSVALGLNACATGRDD